MHKFKIEIQLKNKDYCNGCPLLMEIGIMPEEADCLIHNGVSHEPVSVYPYKYIRPEICKQNEVKE